MNENTTAEYKTFCEIKVNENKPSVKAVLELGQNIINELLKENAELKVQITALTNENNVLIKGLGCETCGITETYNDLNNEIAKLKDLIRNHTTFANSDKDAWIYWCQICS